MSPGQEVIRWMDEIARAPFAYSILVAHLGARDRRIQELENRLTARDFAVGGHGVSNRERNRRRKQRRNNRRRKKR